jgi:hypothetical protein
MHAPLLVIAAALLTITNWRLRKLRPWHLSAQFAFTRKRFHAITDKWAEDGQLSLYRHFLRIDYITLLAYAGFGALWVTSSSSFGELSAERRYALAALLPLAAAADAIENTLQLWFTSRGTSTESAFAYALAGVASCAKFLLIGAFIVSSMFVQYASAG